MKILNFLSLWVKWEKHFLLLFEPPHPIHRHIYSSFMEKVKLQTISTRLCFAYSKPSSVFTSRLGENGEIIKCHYFKIKFFAICCCGWGDFTVSRAERRTTRMWKWMGDSKNIKSLKQRKKKGYEFWTFFSADSVKNETHKMSLLSSRTRLPLFSSPSKNSTLLFSSSSSLSLSWHN